MGYIEEEDDMDTDGNSEDEDGGGGSSGTDPESISRRYHLRARRLPSISGSDSERAARDSANEWKTSFSTDRQQKRQSSVPGVEKNTASGVGAAMTLSAEAAAIVNARSPLPKTPPPPPLPTLPPPRPARPYKGCLLYTSPSPRD